MCEEGIECDCCNEPCCDSGLLVPSCCDASDDTSTPLVADTDNSGSHFFLRLLCFCCLIDQLRNSSVSGGYDAPASISAAPPAQLKVAEQVKNTRVTPALNQSYASKKPQVTQPVVIQPLSYRPPSPASIGSCGSGGS